MTDAEIDFMAKRLNPLLVDGLIWVAEAAGEPVGFMLALPDYNAALKPLRGAAADTQAARISALPARMEMAAALPDHYTGCEGKIPYPGSRSPDAHRRFQNGFQNWFQGRGSFVDTRRHPDDVPVARSLRWKTIQDLSVV